MKLVGMVLALVLLRATLPGVALAAPQADARGDQYFAGTVVESTAEQLTVARILQGRNESKVFHITSDTKFEGRVAPKVRVTVRYVTSDDGDRATLVIVRTEPAGKGK